MESQILITKGDKAREAAKKGRQMLNFGASHNDAAESAAHEIQHAMADTNTKGGRIGINVNVKSGKLNMYYQADR